MSSQVEWTPDAFAAQLQQRLKTRASRPTLHPDRVGYRRAAALLWTFDPRTLRLPSGASGGALAQLVDDCTARFSSGSVRWQLRPEVRREVLASLAGPEEALRYLEPNLEQASATGSARFAHAYLTGLSPERDDLDVKRLERIREAVTWLAMVPGTAGLPDVSDLELRLERARLMEPMRVMLRQTFEGRTAELQRLEEHIGLHSPTLKPRLTWPPRGRRSQDLPLVVHGPAGIGKSTLISKSLLDHLAGSERFPFAYVDSERATVWLHEPLSLIAEMARQLAVQYRSHAGELTRLVDRSRMLVHEQRARVEEVDDLRQVPTTRTMSRSASNRYHLTARDDDAEAARELGRILSRAVAHIRPAPPFVVVLDSFEEAQYRASPVLDRMWTMLAALRDEYPRTRVVVAGRAPVGHPDIDAEQIPVLPLGELDLTAAQQFLVDRGVGPRMAEAIVQRVGGNPLWLSISARVARAAREAGEDEDWVLDIPARRRRFFGAVNDMLIQGMLYDRLLLHITNPEVRALAHPGLVLRRITPRLIREVLAPLCPDADVPDDEKAQRLFDELRRELDLVEEVAPAVLKHRPDVRRVMLPLLASDKENLVRDVERAAVVFYERSDRPEERAEEIYHRLRLGQSHRQVSARWMAEAAPYLTDVDTSELSGRANRVLNRLLGGTVDGMAAAENQLEWEQTAAQVVEDLLTQGFTDEAMRVLGDRRPWTPCSPLHALLAEVLLRKGDLPAARAAVDAALDVEDLEQCGDVRLELLLLSARIAAEVGDRASAEADLDLADRTARHLGHELDALGAMLARARLHEPGDPSRDAAADGMLIERVETLPDDLLASSPALLRSVAAEVGAESPEVLAHALALVGLPALTQERLSMLARTVVAAVDEPAVARLLADLADDDPEHWSRPAVEHVRKLLESLASSGQLDDVARHLLAIPGVSGVVAAGIAAAMEEGIPS